MTDPLRRRLLERDKEGKPVHRYIRAADTDVAKTWARVRRQMKEQEQAQSAANVRPIKRTKT